MAIASESQDSSYEELGVANACRQSSSKHKNTHRKLFREFTEKDDVEFRKVDIFNRRVGRPIFIVSSSDWSDVSRSGLEIKSRLPRECGRQRIFEIEGAGRCTLAKKCDKDWISLIFGRLQDIIEIFGQSCSALGDEGVIDPSGGYKRGRKQTFGWQRRLIIEGLMKSDKLLELKKNIRTCRYRIL